MVRNFDQSRIMETPFYDEQPYHNIGHSNQLKRSLTLDFAQTKIAMKKQKMDNSPLLSSPDLNLLQLRTPDLDKFLLQTSSNGDLIPTTPTTQILFPKVVTEAQEDYARGFVNALYELQHSDSSSQGLQSITDIPVTTSNSNLSGGGITNTYTNLDQFQLNNSNNYLDNVVIKDEPQIVPQMGSPPVSPIDMECQERIKLERKRQRNRVAASKCRRRKLERISKLEDKVKILKGENSDLTGVVNKLKLQVGDLKQQVMEHVHAGCPIITQTY